MCCFAISAIPSGCLKLVSGDSHFSSSSLIKNIRCVCCYFANVSYYLCKMELNLITFGLIPCVLGTAVIGSGIILGRASDPLILELQSYTLMLFFKFVSKKGLHSSADLACSVLQHKGNLSWKKHNQYLSPPAWQSKVQPWLWSLAVRFVRECSVPEELIKPGNV